MKSLLLGTVLGTACVSVLGQGQINFANYAAGGFDQVDAPIFDAPQFGGARLAGSAFAADLYWGPDGTTDSNLLAPLNRPAFFSTGNQVGYFFGGATPIPGAAGIWITAQVRVWDTADGSSWLACNNSGSPTARTGASNSVRILVLGGGGSPPRNLAGLESFGLAPIPEPSTAALVALCATALLVSRGRR